MTNDPIVNALGIRFQRFMLFWALVGLLLIGLWMVLLHAGYNYPLAAIWQGATSFWAGPDHKSFLILLSLCTAVSFLLVLDLYLFVALWWRKRGAIHHRGTRIVDLRDQEQ